LIQNIEYLYRQHLTYPNGILKEPCEPNCDDNQKLYKGIFARHLGYLLSYLKSTSHSKKYTSFLRRNAESLWITNRCKEDGLLGLLWKTKESSECDSTRNIATTSAASIQQPKVEVTSKWTLLGLPGFEYADEIARTITRTNESTNKGSTTYCYLKMK
jgi:predicted alpha-1,6-mannanase (GH76 family)